MAEGQAAKCDESHGFIFAAAILDEAPQPRGLHRRLGQVEPCARVEIQRVGLGVEEPLAWGVELLEDVFNETDRPVHGAAPVVLPAALLRHRTLGVLAGDPPGKVAPERGMHGVKIAARRIGPARGLLRRDRVCGEAVEILCRRIEIRIACQNLPIAVHEDLLCRQILRHIRLKAT